MIIIASSEGNQSWEGSGQDRVECLQEEIKNADERRLLPGHFYRDLII